MLVEHRDAEVSRQAPTISRPDRHGIHSGCSNPRFGRPLTPIHVPSTDRPTVMQTVSPDNPQAQHINPHANVGNNQPRNGGLMSTLIPPLWSKGHQMAGRLS